MSYAFSLKVHTNPDLKNVPHPEGASGPSSTLVIGQVTQVSDLGHIDHPEDSRRCAHPVITNCCQLLDFLVPITRIITNRRIQTPVPECAKKGWGWISAWTMPKLNRFYFCWGFPALRDWLYSPISLSFYCSPHYTSYKLWAWVINQNIHASSFPVFASHCCSAGIIEGASFIFILLPD